jgi:hypothetical protein
MGAAAGKAGGSAPNLIAETESLSTLIKRLSETKPVDWQPGRWRLYEMSEAMPMAVGLVRDDIQPQKAAETAEKPRADLAQLGYQVVIWAFAAPSAENQWTLMLFQPDANGETVVGNSSLVVLPPGCRRTLAVRTADGWEILGFRGTATTEEIKSFFDRQAAGRGVKPAGGWQSRGNAWHVKYVADDNSAVEVRFGPDSRGELSGILMIFSTPKSPNP